MAGCSEEGGTGINARAITGVWRITRHVEQEKIDGKWVVVTDERYSSDGYLTAICPDGRFMYGDGEYNGLQSFEKYGVEYWVLRGNRFYITDIKGRIDDDPDWYDIYSLTSTSLTWGLAEDDYKLEEHYTKVANI